MPELTVKARVYDVCDPARHGTLIVLGPEVSEVHWDAGPKRFVVNKFLRLVKEKAK